MSSAGRQGLLIAAPDGTVSWWSPDPIVVAETEIEVGAGAHIVVDAAEPAAVKRWMLLPGGDVESLARAFGDPTFAQLVSAAPTNEPAVVDQPLLVGPWPARALVAAVDRWSVSGINEGALLLDDAAARWRAGETVAATRLFSLAMPILLDLGERCIDSDITGVAAELIRAVVDDAVESAVGQPWHTEVSDLSAGISAAIGISNADIADFLAELTPHEVVAGGLDVDIDVEEESQIDAESDATLVVWGVPVDPRSVPARVLDWTGADRPELLISAMSNEDWVTITATLSPSIDPLSLEAQQLFAYVTDRRTGRLLASTPVTVVGRQVSALVRRRGVDIDHLGAGFFDCDVPLEDLRASDIGLQLVDVDRHMLQAWRHQRAAIALQSVTRGGADELDESVTAETLLEFAIEFAQRAVGILENILDDPDLADAVTDDLRGSIERRIVAIESYLDGQLAGGAATSAPLLAELLAPDPWDTEESGEPGVGRPDVRGSDPGEG